MTDVSAGVRKTCYLGSALKEKKVPDVGDIGRSGG